MSNETSQIQQSLKANSLQPKEQTLLVPISEVSDDINGVRLTDFQKEKFARGELLFLENMQVAGGRIVDGKVKLVRQDDELLVELYEKKPVLDIPDRIMGYVLTEKDKEDLLAEKVVAIKPLKSPMFFVQLDRELNRVMVRTEKDLSMIREIGGYKLTEADKLKWANGEKLPVRILYDEKTKMYFAAAIRKTSDGKGIEYHEYKSLKDASPAHIQEMVVTHNKPADVLTPAVSVADKIVLEKEKPKEIDPSRQPKMKVTFPVPGKKDQEIQL